MLGHCEVGGNTHIGWLCGIPLLPSHTVWNNIKRHLLDLICITIYTHDQSNCKQSAHISKRYGNAIVFARYLRSILSYCLLTTSLPYLVAHGATWLVVLYLYYASSKVVYFYVRCCCSLYLHSIVTFTNLHSYCLKFLDNVVLCIRMLNTVAAYWFDYCNKPIKTKHTNL